MLGLIGRRGGGERLYVYCYFECCQVAMACNSRIQKAAREATRLKIAIISIGSDCVFACQRKSVEIETSKSKKLKKAKRWSLRCQSLPQHTTYWDYCRHGGICQRGRVGGVTLFWGIIVLLIIFTKEKWFIIEINQSIHMSQYDKNARVFKGLLCDMQDVCHHVIAKIPTNTTMLFYSFDVSCLAWQHTIIVCLPCVDLNA